MNAKYLEENNLLKKDELIEHASIAVMQQGKSDIPGLNRWVTGAVDKKATEIFDLNGKPLFYDFEVRRGNVMLGTVRTAASKILGKPVLSYEMGRRNWNYESSLRKLQLLIRRKYPRLKILSSKLVCYSYPKIGILLEVNDSGGRKSRMVFDIADHQLVREGNPGMTEGAVAFSLYDQFSENARKERLVHFDGAEKYRVSLAATMRKTMVEAVRLEAVTTLELIPFEIKVTRLLPFCSHYGSTESRSHHCFVLHGQQVNDYCAVATAQMILDYYRFFYSQDTIAPHLGYSAGSGCPSDQSAGYKKLSGNHLNASFDNSPTFDEAKKHINDYRPFKSGIPGHARACAGYSYHRLLWAGGVHDRKLYIYDPWPWNSNYKLAGTITWEDWDSVTHTNYVVPSLVYPVL